MRALKPFEKDLWDRCWESHHANPERNASIIAHLDRKEDHFRSSYDALVAKSNQVFVFSFSAFIFFEKFVNTPDSRVNFWLHLAVIGATAVAVGSAVLAMLARGLPNLSDLSLYERYEREHDYEIELMWEKACNTKKLLDRVNYKGLFVKISQVSGGLLFLLIAFAVGIYR